MTLIAAACLALIVHLQAQDPTKAEVPLPALAGWKASLIYEGSHGIWTVRALQLQPRFGCSEVVGLDDKGRCTVLVSYSGKWTPFQTVEDGQWLGALAWVDLDPAIPGRELYTGGKRGNLFRIRPHREGGFDTAIVARFPGLELHTFVAGDLLPSRAGNELLAFTRSGRVFDVTPGEEPGSPFRTKRLASLPGRVRDAVIIPPRDSKGPRIMAAMRAGEVALLRLTEKGLEHHPALEEPMGFGRIARRESAGGEPEVVYVTRDDGVILRLEESAQGSWRREIIYAGPQGARGIVSGRFHEDPDVETVAVFGYSKKVQLLSRRKGQPWQVETIFKDRDKGHWLAVAELDGRNATREIIGSGYGKRIFLLSRPPGYGLHDVPAATEDDHREVAAPAASRTLRVAVKASDAALKGLTPLSYLGGFETKTLVYETLVRRDPDGHIIPALASSWRLEDGGRRFVFELRKGARWHDGSPVTARDVQVHFQRWVGLPEHAWIGASRHIQRVRARGDRTLVIDLDRPRALLPDLCAINPAAIEGPAARDPEGSFQRPCGSGPWQWEGTRENGAVLRYARAGHGEGAIDLVRVDSDPTSLPKALLGGDLDAVIDGWSIRLPRASVKALEKDPGFDVIAAAGSSLAYLSFRLEGATADAELRRRVAAAIDRKRLVDEVELGRADPCWSWAAPALEVWPRSARAGSGPARAVTAVVRQRPRAAYKPLLMIVREAADRQQLLAGAIAGQLEAAGIPARVVACSEKTWARILERGRWDLRIERTWGSPYDPWLSLCARFLPPSGTRSATKARRRKLDPDVQRLVEKAAAEPGESARQAWYRRIQDALDEKNVIVPLYVPHRLAVTRRGSCEIRLDPDLYRLDVEPR